MIHRVKHKQDIHKGKWNGLGGKFLPGETPLDCVTREFKEESGFDLVAPELRAVLTFPDFKHEEDWVVFLFTCNDYVSDQINNDPTKNSLPTVECHEGYLEWVDEDKVKDLPMWEGDQHFLSKLKTTAFFTGRIVYKDKRLVSVDFSN